MPEIRRRAPKYYGAWVGGVYYNPWHYLPLGTTEYRVTDVENILGGREGWRTVSAVFRVGTSFAEIDEEMQALFQDLEANYFEHA